jgi:hypothetical protein
MAKNQCHTCGSEKFGLVQQRWRNFRFCSNACKAKFLATRKRQIGQTTRWLSYLARRAT